MTKKLYAALTAALLGLAMSCGEAGEDIAGFIQGINETQANSVFVQFNAGGSDYPAQKFDFFRTTGEPVITFADENINSKEEWLAAFTTTGEYDFVKDSGKYMSKRGGGGMKPQQYLQNNQTLA
ncbi:MAG: hypothetical protein LBJ35_03595 [Spirochaetaceae bacterium]|jgi:hypothetical protein|nr:hypothetical protein [Spirochaetaceae bacterium]